MNTSKMMQKDSKNDLFVSSTQLMGKVVKENTQPKKIDKSQFKFQISADTSRLLSLKPG